jgi:hypothetical protein
LIKVLALVRQQTRMTCTLQVTQSDWAPARKLQWNLA